MSRAAAGRPRRVAGGGARSIAEYFAQFGDRLPQVLSDQLEGLRKRLG